MEFGSAYWPSFGSFLECHGGRVGENVCTPPSPLAFGGREEPGARPKTQSPHVVVFELRCLLTYRDDGEATQSPGEQRPGKAAGFHRTLSLSPPARLTEKGLN